MGMWLDNHAGVCRYRMQWIEAKIQNVEVYLYILDELCFFTISLSAASLQYRRLSRKCESCPMLTWPFLILNVGFSHFTFGSCTIFPPQHCHENVKVILRIWSILAFTSFRLSNFPTKVSGTQVQLKSNMIWGDPPGAKSKSFFAKVFWFCSLLYY